MDRDGENRRYAHRELVWTAQPNRFLAAEAADLPPGRTLDLGAGEGRNAVWLAQQGWEVTAAAAAPTGRLTDEGVRYIVMHRNSTNEALYMEGI